MRISVYVPKIEMELDVPPEVLQFPEDSVYRDIALTNWVHDQIEYLIEKREVKDEQLI
jgi:hypothetical protein